MRYMMILAVLAFAGCASMGTVAPTETVHVLVDNHNWQAATVFVYRGDTMVRLGVVERGHPRTFRVAYPANGQVRLAVQLAANAGTVETDYIHVDPGVRVEWTLAAVLAQSGYTVRD
jgi:hypothetical protein